VLPAAQPWRTGENGEISADAFPYRDNWDETYTGEKVPLCAASPPTLIEASRPKEIQALLKFGRDSAPPLKITAASSLDEQTSLSITCGSDWTECDGTIEWVWSKFTATAAADQARVPPAFNRPGTTWELCMRKENNAMHTLVRERLADGTSPTIPDTSQILQTLDERIFKLYQARLKVTKQL
jgi:hypothetical protein